MPFERVRPKVEQSVEVLQLEKLQAEQDAAQAHRYIEVRLDCFACIFVRRLPYTACCMVPVASCILFNLRLGCLNSQHLGWVL